MKTQTLFIAVTVIMALSSPLNGQNPNKQSHRLSKEQLITEAEPGNIIRATSGSFAGQSKHEGVPGTAYLDPNFANGIILMKNGEALSGLLLRYNLYTQQMQYIEGNDTLAIGNSQQIEYIQIEDKTFVYSTFICSGEIKQGYFELLEDGECRLLKRWFTRYHIKTDETETEDECGIFYRDCNCFLQFANKPAIPVNTKRKKFLLHFGNQSEHISLLIKEENLKISREADVRKIVAFYNLLF